MTNQKLIRHMADEMVAEIDRELMDDLVALGLARHPTPKTPLQVFTEETWADDADTL